MKLTTRLLVLVAASLSFSCGSDQATTLVTGTLVGHDGRPMELAHVHLLQPGLDQPLNSTEVGHDGHFELAAGDSGAFVIRFTGVGHAPEEIPLYVDSVASIEAEVRLGLPEYADDFSSVYVAGAFNNYSLIPLERQPDGRFEAAVESPGPHVAYVLKGATKTGWTHGTDSRRFEYHELYGYQSVIQTHEGAATVVFDPAKLVRGTDTAEVRFRDPGSRVARHYEIQRQRRRRSRAYERAEQAHLEGLNNDRPFVYDWSSEVSSLEVQLAGEHEPVLQRALLLSLIACADLGAELEPAIARRTLEDIPPTSHMWSYAPWLIPTAVYFADLEDSNRRYRWYLDQVIDSHPSRSVRADVLWLALWHADDDGDEVMARHYYERLVEEHPESPLAEWAHAQFSPDRNIAVGKAIPEFSLTSLDDSELTYSRGDLEGAVYLIDFWATWCLPCVAELPNLHDAYEKFKTRGFQILSVACDDTREGVAAFRRGRWTMPWHHAFHRLEDEAVEPFEVRTIPRAILVDRNGLIVGVDATIRGERLHAVLARVIENGG